MNLCTLSEQSQLRSLSSAHSVQCLASLYSSSSSHHCPQPSSSGAAVSLHVAEEVGLGGQGRGGGGVGRGGRGGGGGGEEGGVGAHLVDVDVGGVEQDVVLPAEAGEDGGDAGDQLGEGRPPLRLGMPALDHHRVATRKGWRGAYSDDNEVISMLLHSKFI